jgi:colanic acid/amylovoran biosynthesis glycosyltransferase
MSDPIGALRRTVSSLPGIRGAADPVPPACLRVAYLLSTYPTVALAFVEREVLALRDAGVTIDTYSVWPSAPSECLSEAAVREAARTTALRRGKVRWVLAASRLLGAHPLACWRALRAVNPGPRVDVRRWLCQFSHLVDAARLRELLGPAGVRHIHVHHANAAADVARLAVIVGRAVDPPDRGWVWTLTMHGPTEFAYPGDFDLAGKLRSATAVASISRHCASLVAQAVAPHAVDAATVVRMHVDPSRYRGHAVIRAARDRGTRILFVGRLVAEKCPDALVDAVRSLRVTGHDVCLDIVGAGPMEEALRAAIAGSDHARLLGPVGQDDLPELYHRADIFCLPSTAEGLPVVLMEAMATELPVVTTRIAGIPELVRDRVSGLLVPPGDPAALLGALRELLDDGDLRYRLGRQARIDVGTEYLPAVNVRRMKDFLARVSPAPDGRADHPR